ncbi:MAG TPA: molybdate ABC transporter substrate-binding protein [Candidatus Bathyarchaeia archaeon]|nr:molybdate ABC transporter substrate-binding protein [Candidatus Bathyarchaeia archaeon]
MKRKYRFLQSLLCGLLAFSLSACGNSHEAGQGTQNAAASGQHENIELYILAAASLSDALKELKPLYESTHEGISLVTTFGSSGTLQQQIEQGAPADVFFSAGAPQMEALVTKGLVAKEQQMNLLTNELVLIVPKDAPATVTSVEDISNPELKKVAIGQPQTVPAGKYAQQSMMNLGVWENIQDKIIFAKDVRQVLTYVETGNVEAGFVYKTDALSSGRIRIAATADPATHQPIVYPLGIVKSTRHGKEAEAFYQWLQGEEAKRVFAKYGFAAPSQP